MDYIRYYEAETYYNSSKPTGCLYFNLRYVEKDSIFGSLFVWIKWKWRRFSCILDDFLKRISNMRFLTVFKRLSKSRHVRGSRRSDC